MRFPVPPLPARVLRGLRAPALVLLAGACGQGPEPAPAGPAPGLVITAVAPRAQTVERSLLVSGSVGPWQEMSLGVELTGVRAAEVLVEVGDVVRAGQPLLRLDRRTLEVRARQAEASLAQARASLELARANARRGDQLLPQRLISSSDADALRAELSKAEAGLATAEADLEAARLNLSFTTLAAPDSGIISARAVQPGQVVSAGAELLRLIRQGRLEWRAELTERDLTRVAPGARVDLAAPDGQRVAGTVRAVSPVLDAKSRTGLVYADLPEPGPLRAGMFAEGRILLGAEPARVLPREAVVFRDGFAYVFVLKALDLAAADPALRRVEQRRIATGREMGDLVEVQDGLGAGDRVVRRGAGFLADGDIVREVPEATAAAPAPGAGAP